jgi:hypothetical protein
VQRAGALPERLRLGQDVAAVSQQVFALRRELDAAPDPVEELHSQIGFQVTDLAGEGRLADVDLLGGLRHAALLGDADEIAEMPELHGIGLHALKALILGLLSIGRHHRLCRAYGAPAVTRQVDGGGR